MTTMQNLDPQEVCDICGRKHAVTVCSHCALVVCEDCTAVDVKKLESKCLRCGYGGTLLDYQKKMGKEGV